MLLLSIVVVGVLITGAFIWIAEGNFGSSSPVASGASASLDASVSTGGSGLLASSDASTPSGASGASASHAPSTGTLPAGDPKPALTPGATNSEVAQGNIKITICKSGFTATIRPPASYTTALKKSQLADSRYGDTADQKTADYEEDHLISLELGGAPKDALNLWPEPYTINYTYQGKVIAVGARSKDKYENYLNAMVCDGKMPLITAQHNIASDWVGGWISAGMPSGAGSASDD
jgi:hypothetical protein